MKTSASALRAAYRETPPSQARSALYAWLWDNYELIEECRRGGHGWGPVRDRLVADGARDGSGREPSLRVISEVWYRVKRARRKLADQQAAMRPLADRRGCAPAIASRRTASVGPISSASAEPVRPSPRASREDHPATGSAEITGPSAEPGSEDPYARAKVILAEKLGEMEERAIRRSGACYPG